MDLELKQRLVGAVVITALAAIFVPMLFDDPVDQTGQQINELTIPSLPERLVRSQKLVLPESTDAVINLPKTEPLQTVTAESENRPQLQQWFLQVGLFSQHSNAITQRDNLRKQGFSATVKKVSVENKTLFKVLIGPEMNKERAELTKAGLEKLNIKSFITQE
jgi:DedD protein